MHSRGECIDAGENMSSLSSRFPELPLAGFGFLLHFAWEMMQVPWFDGMLEASHGTVVWLCTRATFGDVVIMVFAFWVGSWTVRSRTWVVARFWRPVLVTIATGLLITVVFEWMATGMLDRWSYADTMPVVPGVGIGLTPFLQWLLLPPLVLWLTRNHILGSVASDK